jgi:hypothetical protein
MLESLLTTTDAALEAVPAPVIPHWHIEATYSGGIFPGYSGTDFTQARLSIADFVLAAGTESVVVWRNGIVFRQLTIERN